MNNHISIEDITNYQKDGVIKICNFLTPDELIHWRDIIESAVGERTERIPGANDGGVIGDEYYDNVFKQRVNLWRTSKAVKEIVLDARIGKMAALLEGIDTVRIWHDQALFKEPWANPTAWHLDDPYWSFYSRHATTIWVALDDVTIQNGALCHLPGAHKQARYDNVDFSSNFASLFDVYPIWKSIEPQFIEMKAGEASFHNGLMPHAAGPNMTLHPRRAFAIIFMPDGSVFNGQQNVLPKPLFETLEKGDLLDNDEHNPIVFSAGNTL